MKLVASMIVRNEYGRYLEPCLGHLLEFCDEVVVVDDGSTEKYGADGRPTDDPDGLPWEVLVRDRLPGVGLHRVHAVHLPHSAFFAHEGRARQTLLDWTLQREPTHILAIDADEFVADGAAVRAAVERDARHVGAWTLCMQEVWSVASDHLDVRQDGGWREHEVPILWRVDALEARALVMPDRALASGRTPDAVRRLRRGCADSAILHLGWANRAQRQARYDRYAVHDGGRFHASSHLESIMWPDERVQLTEEPWPDGLLRWRDPIYHRAGAA